MKNFIFILSVLVASFVITPIALAADHELPRVYVDTKYPDLVVGHIVRNVKTECAVGEPNCYTDLQQAIDEAKLGEEIIVQAGMIINGPITLKNKTSGSGWIVIKSSQPLGIPPQGKRVVPALHAKAMPKILAPTSSNAINTENGAHHYRIVGFEIKKSSPDALVNNLIYLGKDEMTSLLQVPHHIVLDRIYAHGDTGNLRRCVTLNSAHTAVIDSYISECHEVGADSQAIGGWNGPGPFKIVNNYIEGAGENLMFGGALPKIPGLVPEDIEIKRNYFFKPLSWKVDDPNYAGTHWVVKNLFELKSAHRVLVDGNVFENSWKDGQSGIAILLKSNSVDGRCTWCETAHVTFSNNIVRNALGGLTINAAEPLSSPPKPANNIRIKNVLFENINGRLFQIYGGVNNVTIENVTGFATSSILLGSGVNNNFKFVNNIVQRGSYGIGTGANEGTTTLKTYFPPPIYDKVVLVNTSTTSNSTLLSKYPAGTFVENKDSVGFVDIQKGNYRLSPLSPHQNKGTDGKDIGADIDAIEAAIDGRQGVVHVQDDFDDNLLDTAKWVKNNLFSGTTDITVPVKELNQQLEIGPLLSGVTGSHYNGLKSVNVYDLLDSYAQVELKRAPEAGSNAYAMFTAGPNGSNFYRMYVSNGELHLEKKIKGMKTDIFKIAWDMIRHKFLRIGHDASTGNVIFEAGTNAGGNLIDWTSLHGEIWDAINIPLGSIKFEIKGGTSYKEITQPGAVIFDNFKVGR